jgi:signal transduction histidine kinase
MSVALGTALVGAMSVYAIRRVLHQDLVDSAAAQRVIRVAKLHSLAERMGGHTRGFLLTGDPGSFDHMMADREVFFDRLDVLLRSADQRSRAGLERVHTAARENDDALGAVMALRRDGHSPGTVARAFEERVGPRTEALAQRLRQLIETEEERLESLDRSTERAASRVATVTTGAAGGALVVSLALAVLLARAFGSLRRKQGQLEQALGRVEQANRDLDAFAGRIAHDLRTPLTPIALSVERLKRSSDQSVLRAAERIERGAHTANQMLEELLAFSRMGRSETGTARAAPIIRDTLEDLAEKVADSRIEVEARLDENAVVACTGPLFREVVANLAGNAVKFMAGRDERRLGLELRAHEGRCELVVQDTGPGIPAAGLERIFDPFYRLPGADSSGSGLGLAIVRRIVEAHGGTITARSVVGRGTTFRVLLPAAQMERAPSPQPALSLVQVPL